MNKFKEKLFGLIVIISLAVIFLPMLFKSHDKSHDQKLIHNEPEPQDGEKNLEIVINSSELENTPEASPSEINAPINEKHASTESVKKDVKKEEVTKKTERVKNEKLKKQIIERKVGWVVQLGLFAKPKHATDLVVKLRSAGYPAYTRVVRRDNHELIFVLVGPYLKKSDARKLISALETQFKIEGIMVHHEP